VLLLLAEHYLYKGSLDNANKLAETGLKELKKLAKIHFVNKKKKEGKLIP